MHRITQLQEANGSFGDILSTYYAVPTLCGQSFLSVGRKCTLKDAGKFDRVSFIIHTDGIH